MSYPVLQKAISHTKRLLEAHHVDESHGLQHAMTVLGHVQGMIAHENRALAEDDAIAVQLAALLHDVDDRKYFFTHADAENARCILAAIMPEQETLHCIIIKMINLVSTSTNGNNREGVEQHWMLFPRFADRLEAIGPIGVQRCFAYTQHCKNPLFTSTTPRVQTEEELWQVATKDRFALYCRQKTSESFIDHFYDKLLHIGSPEAFNSDNAYLVKNAKERHQYMIDFILQFGKSGCIDLAAIPAGIGFVL